MPDRWRYKLRNQAWPNAKCKHAACYTLPLRLCACFAGGQPISLYLRLHSSYSLHIILSCLSLHICLSFFVILPFFYVDHVTHLAFIHRHLISHGEKWSKITSRQNSVKRAPTVRVSSPNQLTHQMETSPQPVILISKCLIKVHIHLLTILVSSLIRISSRPLTSTVFILTKKVNST